MGIFDTIKKSTTKAVESAVGSATDTFEGLNLGGDGSADIKNQTPTLVKKPVAQTTTAVEPIVAGTDEAAAVRGEKVFQAEEPLFAGVGEDKVVGAEKAVAPEIIPAKEPVADIAKTTELFDEQGALVSKTKDDVIGGEAITGEEFFLTNPLTGEQETFEDSSKRDKRKKELSEKQTEIAETDTLNKISQDFIATSNEFLSNLQNPDTPDPIKTAQTNEFITAFGPRNQALTDNMILNLKQNNQAGSGAGNALLFNMARGNAAEMSNIKARLNTESAQRIFNANKYGMEKGLEIRNNINREKQQKLSNDSVLMATAIEAGDFDNVRRIAEDIGLTGFDTAKLETMNDIELAKFVSSSLTDLGFKPEAVKQFSNITGIELDPNDIAVLDEATQKIIETRMNSIEAIKDPEQRKVAMTKLAQEYPEAFGFPGDPVNAVAMVGGMDFTNPEANAQAQSDVDKFWQAEAVKDAPNLNGVITTGKSFWTQYNDASIDSQYGNAVSKFEDMDADAQAQALEGMEQFGVESVDDIDTREEKEGFLSLAKFNNKKKNVSAISTELFENLGQVVSGTDMESWFDGTDPTKEAVAREWIADIMIGGNYSTDSNGNIVPNLQDIAKPWEENASQFEFMTWPRKYGDDGELLPEGSQYSGKEFRDDLGADSIQNDPGSIAEDEELTRKYLQYRKENPNELNWLEWYDETKGGSQSVQFTEGVISNFDTILSEGTEGLRNVGSNEFADVFNFNSINAEDLFELFQDPTQVDKLKEAGFLELTSKEITEIKDTDEVIKIKRNPLKQRGFVMIVDGRPFKVEGMLGLSGAKGEPNITGVFLDEDPETREVKEF